MFEFLAIGRDSLKRVGLVGVGMAFLEEVYHHEGSVTLRSPVLKLHPVGTQPPAAA